MDNISTGYWKKTNVNLKQKVPTVTEHDLSFHEGKEKEMIELLGFKLGKTNLELLYIIAAL